MGIVVAITGASGAAYGRRLVELLVEGGLAVDLIVSPHGEALLASELGMTAGEMAATAGGDRGRIRAHDYGNLADPLASGSNPTDGMAVCPCSCHTLASIAAGLSDNLITRAAQVSLKERRRLVLCPRETPLSAIDLRNMAAVTEAGAIVAPLSPGFYHRPGTVEDLIDFMAGRVLDLLGVGHGLGIRWDGQAALGGSRS